MWKFAGFYGTKGSVGARPAQDRGLDEPLRDADSGAAAAGRGFDIGSPAAREIAGGTAVRGRLTAAQSHEVWAACTQLRCCNVDGEEMLHGVSIVLKARNTGINP